MSKLEIRAMRGEEIESVIAIWRAAGLTRPWNDPREDIRFCRESGHGDILVGEADGAIRAAMMVGHDGHRGMVGYVGVPPEFQRHGYGGEMVAAAETWLRARGVWKLNLLIRAGNEQVRSFYESLGYEAQPRIYMEKWLDESRRPKPPG